MKKTVDEINKMIMEDAPMEEINDAIGYIDICSCFDPIFEPPIDFLEECRKRWEAAQSSFCKTIECKIGNTCGGGNTAIQFPPLPAPRWWLGRLFHRGEAYYFSYAIPSISAWSCRRTFRIW